MRTRNKNGVFQQEDYLRKYDGYSILDKLNDGYEILIINSKQRALHIYIWEKFNGSRPKGYDVHHKNEIRNDNRLENLELLSRGDHKKLHAGWIKENGVWTSKPCSGCNQMLPLKDFYLQKNGVHNSKCKNCLNESFNQWTIKNKDRAREAHRLYKKAHRSQYNEYERQRRIRLKLNK